VFANAKWPTKVNENNRKMPFLKEFIDNKRRHFVPQPPCDPPPCAVGPSFSWAGFGVIAEIKRASPSRGAIADHPLEGWAASLAAGGAAALSVLTEPIHFAGSLAFLPRVRSACALPLLRKDFLIAECELDEAVDAGASAVLLIAAALPVEDFINMYKAARARDLAVLAEIHDLSELTVVDRCPDALVGVNQRDLHSLAVDKRFAERVAPALEGRPFIVESGIENAADLRWARDLGAKGVLVGEALARTADPGATLRQWLSTI
jgi:indole-3-glycerol phosphate synthase